MVVEEDIYVLNKIKGIWKYGKPKISESNVFHDCEDLFLENFKLLVVVFRALFLLFHKLELKFQFFILFGQSADSLLGAFMFEFLLLFGLEQLFLEVWNFDFEFLVFFQKNRMGLLFSGNGFGESFVLVLKVVKLVFEFGDFGDTVILHSLKLLDKSLSLLQVFGDVFFDGLLLLDH